MQALLKAANAAHWHAFRAFVSVTHRGWFEQHDTIARRRVGVGNRLLIHLAVIFTVYGVVVPLLVKSTREADLTTSAPSELSLVLILCGISFVAVPFCTFFCCGAMDCCCCCCCCGDGCRACWKRCSDSHSTPCTGVISLIVSIICLVMNILLSIGVQQHVLYSERIVIHHSVPSLAAAVDLIGAGGCHLGHVAHLFDFVQPAAAPGEQPFSAVVATPELLWFKPAPHSRSTAVAMMPLVDRALSSNYTEWLQAPLASARDPRYFLYWPGNPDHDEAVREYAAEVTLHGHNSSSLAVEMRGLLQLFEPKWLREYAQATARAHNLSLPRVDEALCFFTRVDLAKARSEARAMVENATIAIGVCVLTLVLITVLVRCGPLPAHAKLLDAPPPPPPPVQPPENNTAAITQQQQQQQQQRRVAPAPPAGATDGAAAAAAAGAPAAALPAAPSVEMQLPANARFGAEIPPGGL